MARISDLQSEDTGSCPVRDALNIYVKICPKCDIAHDMTGKFCSRSCSNSRSWTDADKIKKSIAAKNSDKVIAANIARSKIRDSRICKCGVEFQCLPNTSKKYCSFACATLFKDKTNIGGYREGSGRSKSGYYKGIFCASTYELCWVIYALDHNTKFTRFPGGLEKDGLKYYPDFLLEDGKTIIETKGIKSDDVEAKTKLAESFGYTVRVLYKEDLKHVFDYVADNYSKNYQSLYDDYKPRFNYVCYFCSEEFSRDYRLKTDIVFCSRTCTGRGHIGRK